MQTQLPMGDGEPFISRMEAAFERGDAEFIEGNMPRLEQLIHQYQERIYHLAQLQYRARQVRNGHEPSADKRQIR